MSNTSKYVKRIGITLLATGTYVSAVYFTLQFVSLDNNNHDTNNSTNNDTNRKTYINDPQRTQTFQKIAKAYDDQINRDEIVMGLPLLRRSLLYFHARGKVLEVGAGTGRNLDYYPLNSIEQVILTDSSDQMLLKAHEKLKTTISSSNNNNQKKFQMFCADAKRMTDYYPENTFDTIVDTFGLCSYDDPVAVLKELARVCNKEKGKILLLEHGRSKSWKGLSNYLDKNAERHAKNWGCVWNRDLDAIIEQSGLVVESLHTWHFGTTYYVVCRPARDGENTITTTNNNIVKKGTVNHDRKDTVKMQSTTLNNTDKLSSVIYSNDIHNHDLDITNKESICVDCVSCCNHKDMHPLVMLKDIVFGSLYLYIPTWKKY